MDDRPARKISDIATKRRKVPEHNALTDAFRKVAKTPEGQVITDWFASMLTATAGPGAQESALRDLEAERRVALRFLRMMSGHTDERDVE